MDGARFECLLEPITSGQLEIVEGSISRWTRHCRKGPLFTALHDYHHESKTAIVKVLLEHGSGSGRGLSAGRTYPLQRAVEDGVEIATLPVEYGADVNAVAERQGLPLYLALGWCDSY